MEVTQYCDGNDDSDSSGTSEYFILTFLLEILNTTKDKITF